MPDVCRPDDIAALRAVVADAATANARLAIRGGGTKASVGRETPDAIVLDMGAFAGVVDYDPAELVLTLGAATPLAEVNDLLAREGQALAFDPFDHAAMLAAPGRATIGGIVAAGVAGPLRLSGGGARDHLLGFEAVSGRAEHFVAGARVVKNVTGYDLSKVVTGSWGRLVALTQLSLKVLPRPREAATLLLHGLSTDAAVAAMAQALGSRAEVAAAAHLPGYDGRAVTALRLHGFAASVAARCEMLTLSLDAHGPCERLDPPAADNLWRAVATAATLRGDRPLWRIVVQPRLAPALVASLDGDWLMDWAGGLVWLASDADHAAVRSAAERAGGHAMLFRADAAMRASVPALHPLPAGVALLEERVRRAFDPAGVFETGRF